MFRRLLKLSALNEGECIMLCHMVINLDALLCTRSGVGTKLVQR